MACFPLAPFYQLFCSNCRKYKQFLSIEWNVIFFDYLFEFFSIRKIKSLQQQPQYTIPTGSIHILKYQLLKRPSAISFNIFFQIFLKATQKMNTNHFEHWFTEYIVFVSYVFIHISLYKAVSNQNNAKFHHFDVEFKKYRNVRIVTFF